MNTQAPGFGALRPEWAAPHPDSTAPPASWVSSIAGLVSLLIPAAAPVLKVIAGIADVVTLIIDCTTGSVQGCIADAIMVVVDVILSRSLAHILIYKLGIRSWAKFMARKIQSFLEVKITLYELVNQAVFGWSWP